VDGLEEDEGISLGVEDGHSDGEGDGHGEGRCEGREDTDGGSEGRNDGSSLGAVESETEGGSEGGNDGSSLGDEESDGGEEEEGLPLTVGDPDGKNSSLTLLSKDLGVVMNAPAVAATPKSIPTVPNMYFCFLFNHDC